jgi:hypothetical protein
MHRQVRACNSLRWVRFRGSVSRASAACLKGRCACCRSGVRSSSHTTALVGPSMPSFTCAPSTASIRTVIVWLMITASSRFRLRTNRGVFLSRQLLCHFNECTSVLPLYSDALALIIAQAPAQVLPLCFGARRVASGLEVPQPLQHLWLREASVTPSSRLSASVCVRLPVRERGWRRSWPPHFLVHLAGSAG